MISPVSLAQISSSTKPSYIPTYHGTAFIKTRRSASILNEYGPYTPNRQLISRFIPQDSKTPLYQKIWRSTKDEDLVTSYTEGMERVFSERYALMIWEVFYSLNYGQDCRAFVLPVSYFPIYTSFGLAKESPLVPIMNKV